MADLFLNSVVNGSIELGQTNEYNLTLPSNGKYVVETGGNADVLVGVWSGNVGMLRICGVGRRGVRTLGAGNHTVKVVGQSAGAYTIKVRSWSFFDYFTMFFYKSSC